jgi:predicted nucleic-acid-binding Zn-ribbon protein
MRTCPKCSYEVADDAKICRVCGSIVSDIRSPAPTDRQPDAAQQEEPDDPELAVDVTASLVPSEEVTGTEVVDVRATEYEATDEEAITGEASEDERIDIRHNTGSPWTCSRCGEHVERNFDVCWNCGTDRDGNEDPDFFHEWDGTERDSAERDATQDVVNFEPVTMPISCSHCGSNDLYTRRLSSAGSEGPYFLAGLGGFMHYAHFDVVVCAQCGLTLFFAEPSAREQLESNEQWVPLRNLRE